MCHVHAKGVIEMISLGAKVRIARLNPRDGGQASFIGLTGEVVRREVGSGKWPCGETPADPLYFVKTCRGTDAFWSEELAVL